MFQFPSLTEYWLSIRRMQISKVSKTLVGGEKKKREELEKILEENNRKIEEQKLRLDEEQLKLVEEQRKVLEERQARERLERLKQDSEQAMILNKKDKKRPKLSFSLNSR
ncbi:hypothetical protein EB796_006030 [Bugula neritina]|uniref:Uncharacterized protein n=1 Tax=Bugula neritina TaxID=10212 RepID=A0A7J7KCL1_BUGNE|nr:hypothetical protein EB796_006030 [Bugula neritina]